MPQSQTFSSDLLNTLPQGSNPDKLTIDQVNIAMRSSPVWNQWMAAHHIDPNDAHLSGSDKNGLAKTLENQGFALPEGWEIDDAGNIREETHIGRNIMIAAAIAGAAFGGYALLAAYGSSAAAGAGGAAAAEAGAGAGAAGAAGAGTAAAAGLGGVEGAATAGLGASAAAGTLGSAAAGSTAMGLGAGSAAAGAGTLASTQIGTGMVGSAEAGAVPTGMGGAGAFDAAGNFVGDSTVGGGNGAGTMSRIARGAQAARGIAGGINAATEAAAAGRATQQNAGLTANGQNIQGQSAFESELLARSREEDSQRKEDLKNVYRSSVAQNPHVSPFSRSGAPKYSQQYMDTIGAVAGQGADRLKTGPAYSTNNMPALRPYTPINPADVRGATGTNPSTLERVGQYVGPALSTYATLAQIYGW
jgi:hypothetical protein